MEMSQRFCTEKRLAFDNTVSLISIEFFAESTTNIILKDFSKEKQITISISVISLQYTVPLQI